MLVKLPEVRKEKNELEVKKAKLERLAKRIFGQVEVGFSVSWIQASQAQGKIRGAYVKYLGTDGEPFYLWGDNYQCLIDWCVNYLYEDSPVQ